MKAILYPDIAPYCPITVCPATGGLGGAPGGPGGACDGFRKVFRRFSWIIRYPNATFPKLATGPSGPKKGFKMDFYEFTVFTLFGRFGP